MEQQYSAWTLQTERSALRMFFQNRLLTDCVELPQRRRENIKRSRLPAKRDSQINLENWQHVIKFGLASGLRREEMRDLYVRDQYVRPGDQRLVVRVVKGKGGKWREVPVFPGREEAVLSVVKGREPDAHVLEASELRREFGREIVGGVC
jgi:hypothetical protein